MFDSFDDDKGSEPFAFQGEIKHTHGKGILIAVKLETDKPMKVKSIWFPISQVEQVNETTFEIPTWLARKKDLVE